MVGFAKTLFCQRFEYQPKPLPWHLLEKALKEERLAAVDLSIAEKLLGKRSEDNQPQAAFICHLSQAARLGHLCLMKEQEAFHPRPQETWLRDSFPLRIPPQLNEDEIKQLVKWILEGFENFPPHLICCDPAIAFPHQPLCQWENMIYFQKHWICETQVLHHLARLLATPPDVSIDSQHVAISSLLPEQRQAIHNACKHSLTIISGGPGTGKTHTAGQLIGIILRSLPAEAKEHYQIAAAAPTGKAVANLQASLSRALLEQGIIREISAKTLHSLLGIREKRWMKNTSKRSILSADLIIVDESSMIDAQMMAQLLEAIKPGARLILLGDKDQLPPVESGSFFADLTSSSDSRLQERISLLKTCMRTDLKEILDFAQLVNRGQSDQVLQLLKEGGKAVQPFAAQIDPGDHYAIQQAILKTALEVYPSSIDPKETPEAILKKFAAFRILSPIRKGPLGVDWLNDAFQEQALRSIQPGQAVCAPIIITHNDYSLELFNGEIGVIVKRGSYSKEGDYALFPSRNPASTYRKVPAILLPRYEYAYCLSVHKSQGSEFDHILIILPEGSESFGREVLYTAATRARSSMRIWSSPATIQSTLDHHSYRLSGILKRIAGK